MTPRPGPSARTLAQKLVAKAAGASHVAPGQRLRCRVDLAMCHDASGPQRHPELLAAPGARIWDRDKVVLVIDHHVPEADAASRRMADSPAHVRSVDDLERTPIGVAYIGACTGAKLDDLRAAARVLAGFRVAAGVQLFIAPASLKDAAAAQSEGILRCLVDAGATLLPSACGACAGHGNLNPQGASVISSSARNLQSSLGAASARVFLASPYTVAASALRGVIADAREVLA